MSPRVIQVIESEILLGCGVVDCRENHEHQPIRKVRQYHSLDGELLAEHDPVLETLKALGGYAPVDRGATTS